MYQDDYSVSPPQPSNSVPKTMNAIEVKQFVERPSDASNLKEVMTMNSSAPVPLPKKNELLIRVQACSISPGDVVMIRGNMIIMHPSSFPFVPGMDVCGEVVDANGSTKFKTGDIVVAANGMSPVGGMAEYMVIPEDEAVIKPADVNVDKAAASSSAITARNAVMDYVKKGDRVLILGGSGGVGSSAIQIAKQHAGASFVATTSTQVEFCEKLGADVVVDYRKENWWEKEWDEKFDKIIDTVGGGNFTNKANIVLKPGAEGGYFVAITGDDTKPDCTTWWKVIKFFASLPGRPLYTWLFKQRLPAYTLLMPYDISKGRKEVLSWMQDKSLDVHLDESSPLPFTKEGVLKAFCKAASGHAHGKVVVSMASQ
jgi:2-desacetyl-2-hydroxyethyl bacteriochlorophyllide A dehydrogenase